MNLYLADENLDRRLIDALRKDGWILHSIYESHRSASDDEVIEIANKLDAIIITEDKDFGELTFRLGKRNRGIVLIRLRGVAIQQKIALIRGVLTSKDRELVRALYSYTSQPCTYQKLEEPVSCVWSKPSACPLGRQRHYRSSLRRL